MMIRLALPRGLEPLFSPSEGYNEPPAYVPERRRIQ